MSVSPAPSSPTVPGDTGAGEAAAARPGAPGRAALRVQAAMKVPAPLGGPPSTSRRRDQAGLRAEEPRTPGRTSDLRYQVNGEDPRHARWPELKARIGTAGYDPGAA